MPRTTSRAPLWLVSSIASSSIGTMASRPSIENCFLPRKALCRYFSSDSTSDRRRSRRLRSSLLSSTRNSPDSIALRSHTRRLGPAMCSIS